MDWFDAKSPVPGGGSAASGGRFYHVSFRSGSRGNGACAQASYDYITREGEYGHGELDPAIYTESEHMPSWAHDAPDEYWDAADLYERANGRLYVSADFALPRDLATKDQIALARDFAQELTRDEALPYTLAIHAGRDRNGHEHNPHAHTCWTSSTTTARRRHRSTGDERESQTVQTRWLGSGHHRPIAQRKSIS